MAGAVSSVQVDESFRFAGPEGKSLVKKKFTVLGDGGSVDISKDDLGFHRLLEVSNVFDRSNSTMYPAIIVDGEFIRMFTISEEGEFEVYTPALNATLEFTVTGILF